MNDFLEMIKNRRSIRKYLPQQVTEEELRPALEAAITAPTGKDMQAPTIVVVQNPEEREILRRMNAEIMGLPEGKDPFYRAPTVVVFLSNPEVPTWFQDGCAALTTFAMAVEACGLSGCWINRAKEEFERPEGKELLRRWGLPEHLAGIGHYVVGHRLPEYEPKPRAPRKADYVVWRP